jgi:trehalose/maltose hydrolase-like predicted phosphorylase
MLALMIQTELDVLRDVAQRLEAEQISYMLTGSLAMNYYAQPRMTRDIDLIIEIGNNEIGTFLRAFESDYYVNRVSIGKAIAQRSMFNLIHNKAIIKVDCVVLKNDEYRREEFSRRTRVRLGAFETWIVSREDLILSKLVWAKTSRFEMQLRDVKNLLEGECDLNYLQDRAKLLTVHDMLEELIARDE